MHLAGALQAAGFPQVVGTLWELDDEVAVEITEDFYRGLSIPGTETLDPARAAYSLHRAIRAAAGLLPRYAVPVGVAPAFRLLSAVMPRPG